ncbi:uncharacterized protein LOC121973841 [Zingiber officinale]|uniref:uncharacterized protein LOC121973841 n=1 Tax=Zingiber officinale TaxID=94328 RepID=UPI001C4B0937|nr:uncharacterized protein LOC121973841 [Zingiber officinale]
MANTSTEGSASEFGRPEGGTGRRRFFSSGRIPRKTRIGSSSAARLLGRGAGASPPPLTPTRSTMSSGLAQRTSSSSSYSMPSPPTPTAVPLTARCLFTVLGLFAFATCNHILL